MLFNVHVIEDSLDDTGLRTSDCVQVNIDRWTEYRGRQFEYTVPCARRDTTALHMNYNPRTVHLDRCEHMSAPDCTWYLQGFLSSYVNGHVNITSTDLQSALMSSWMGGLLR